MSRLADILTGMDRGRRRPSGVGGIAGLARPAQAPRRWRLAVSLVMLGAMAVLAAVLLVQPQSSAPPAKAVVLPVRPSEPPTRPTPEATASTLVRRGLEVAQTGAAGEAAILFRQAIEAHPSNAEAWNGLGVVLARQGETAEAIDAFRRAIGLRAGYAEAHRNLAVVLDRRGRSAEAATEYRAFLAQAGASHPDRDGVSRRLAELGKSRP
jgi:tetratricopeptide (TPR) repeat protein